MICICCLREFAMQNLVYTYRVVNVLRPDEEPKPHSGLCQKCFENPFQYPQSMN
jgi:hypothetical protein